MKRTTRTAAAIAAAGAMILGMGVATASAAAPTSGLVAEYLFSQTSGASVPNTAAGAALGPATVRNVQSSDWTGSALTMRGGAKTSTGNWVELPANILSGKTSATITAEVKASAAMLSGFHFLWNIGNDSSATEYLFASLNCASGRTPLVGIKSGGSERLVSSSSCGATANQWMNVTSVIDGAAQSASLYIDGVRVAQGTVPFTPANIANQSLNTIGRAPWPDPLFQGSISAFRVYDRALAPAEITALSDADAQAHTSELRAQAQTLIDALALTDRETRTDLDLATSNGRIAWTSSNPAVLAADGTVTPPLSGTAAVPVQLTATATVRGVTATRTVTITVQPSDESAADRVARLAGRFVLPPVVASGHALPAAPAGTSVEVVSATGGVQAGSTITVGGSAAVDSTITVRVTDTASATSTTRAFAVRVLPASAATPLLAYGRTPTTVQEANNADVALSMHLALGSGGTWTPLNENYGIWFAKTSSAVPAAGTSDAIIRSLRDPHLFAMADGTYGAVAVRTARGGGADGTQTSRLLFARSADLRSYQEVGLVDLGVTSGVNDPAVVFDSAANRYVVTWRSDAGVAMYTSFGDLANVATRGPVLRGTVASTAGETSAAIPNYASGNALVVPNAIAAQLRVRFGRVANTGVQTLAGVSVENGAAFGASALPSRVGLTYDDGSSDTRAIRWDAASIARVNTSVAGTYQVTGTVGQTEYATPFADERADPSVFRYDWNGQQKFLMIATEDIYGGNINPQGGGHMPIRVADSIEDLSDEAIAAGRNREVDLLRRGDTDADGGVMTGCFWAPEYHVIGGKLSILFMPCYNGSNGQPDMWTGRASIMQLKQDAQGRDLDPAIAANWTKPQKVVRSDGSILNPTQNISLDMTYVVDGGQSYYIWQMLGALFIAKVDPANPTRLTSAPVRILVPEYAWDNTIAEGPNVYARNGILYMLYSGSTVGDTYTTGLATAASGSDLTSPAAWTKLNYPIQKSGMFNGAWQLGTGHGMWSQDEEDNLLYVFHARTDHNNLSGRDMFVRRVHFAADGMPILDMESDEEVAPANRTVTATVTVQAAANLDITGAATSRCVAGKAVQVVTVTNRDDVPVQLSVTGPHGQKSFGTVQPGKSASASFTTRLAGYPAGSLALTARGTVGGQPVSVDDEISYAGANCG